jgi:endonuclease/exonuclease/phosphatase family metal-dependent hydrolase
MARDGGGIARATVRRDGRFSGRASDVPLLGQATAPDLHVMTYNIRRRMPHLNPRSPDLWAQRKFLLRRLLATERPTLLGVQEGLLDQVLFLAESLGPAYRWIGHGRNADRRGERCVIFYDTRRLALSGWSQLALSDTPGVPGSRSWGNMIPRTAVSARFTDLATGAPLHTINTHLDHISEASRLRSARMLADLVRSAGGTTVVMGDANSGTRSKPFDELTHGADLVDAWSVAQERLTPAWGTYSNYRRPKRDGRRIDWMLVSRDLDVRAAGINAVRYGGSAASDHEPVQGLLRLREASASTAPPD